MNKSLSLSKTFNSKSLNRFVLWKKGYFTNRDSLPSLHIFEINVLLAKFFYYKKMLSADDLRIFPFAVEVLRNYVEKHEVLEQSLQGLRDPSNVLMLEENLNKEFKEKNFKEKQTSLFFMYDLLNEHIAPYALRLDYEEFGYLPEFDQLVDALIEYLPRSNLIGSIKLKCLQCLDCVECEGRLGKLKKPIGLEDLLKKLIRMKTGFRFNNSANN